MLCAQDNIDLDKIEDMNHFNIVWKLLHIQDCKLRTENQKNLKPTSVRSKEKEKN